MEHRSVIAGLLGPTCLRSIYLLWMAFFLFGTARGQNDTLKHLFLKEVEIPGKGNIELESGTSLQQDSLRQKFQHNLTLAEKLNTNNSLFVKQYGQGVLATPSLRGSNAQQVALIWEGVPIQSSLNGTYDLNLIPAELFEMLRLETGSGSSLRGSSAVAGSITFSNPQSSAGNAINVFHTLSSSGIQRTSGILQTGRKKWSGRLGFGADFSKNNFLYDSLGKNIHQRHAEQQIINLLPELHYRINSRQMLYLKSWLHHSKKNLPKLMHEQHNAQQQEDEVFRMTGGYKWFGRNSVLHLFTSKIIEKIRYLDHQQNIDAPSTAEQIYSEGNIEKKGKNWLLLSGLSHQYLVGKAAEIDTIQRQHRAALFSSIQYSSNNQKFKSRLHLRQDFYDRKLAPFTPSLELEYQLLQPLRIMLSGARVFRLPTFNDRFWEPGGNPNLRPEQGYSAEGSLKFNHRIRFKQNSSALFVLDHTFFSRIIHDWIQWEPTGAYWSAHNVFSVWSRGTESRWRIEYLKGKMEILLGGAVNYTLATLPDDGSVHENLRGKQLLYTPLYSVLNFAGLQYSGVQVLFQQQYFGFRYTSSDNFDYLSPYRIYHLSVSKQIKVNDWHFTTQFSIQNLFDESYQVVAQRPMPGRFYQVQINLQYQHL